MTPYDQMKAEQDGHVDEHGHVIESLVNRVVDSATRRADRIAFKVMQVRDLLGRDRRARWRVSTTLDKFEGNWTAEQIAAGEADQAHVERLQRQGNLLMYGGVSLLWQCAIGNGTSTAGQALTFLSNTRAAIGVGDSTTAAAATQTDLQAASNKTRVGMDSGYPSHTDATTSGAATITFRSTYDTSTANFAWQEWGVFNSSTAATGRMVNRKVESLGTKPNTQTWQFTITITIS